MVRDSREGHDGGVNDTTSTTEEGAAPPPDDGFDRSAVNRLSEVRRSSHGSMIAGVSVGLARHFNIDPVIVRIAFVVLTFTGLAGPILYLAGWVLIPREDSDTSPLGESLGLGEKDAQWRPAALVAAAAIAVLAIVGDSAWGFGGWGSWVVLTGAWIAVPALFFYWLFVGRRRAERSTAAEGPVTATWADPGTTAVLTTPRRRWSPALVLATVSTIFIVLGSMWLWAQTNEAIDASVYVATALGITALGLLIGTRIGDAGWLVPLGLVLSFVLAASTLLPSDSVGEHTVEPTTASALPTSIEWGVGAVVVDLGEVSDPADLAGRRLTIENGVGLIRVIVPEGVTVVLDTRVRFGSIEAFDENREGARVTYRSTGDPANSLVIDAQVRLGAIEVIGS